MNTHEETQSHKKVSNEDIKFYLKLNQTFSYTEIYDTYFKDKYGLQFDTFRKKMSFWKKKFAVDEEMLESANLAYKFKPYRSTVQVDKKGNVVQAWIKQQTNVEDYISQILDAIKENIEPVKCKEFKGNLNDTKMLEIPLFDMHFGVCDYEYYNNTKERIISIINKNNWDEINLLIGQDLLHNDGFEGKTTKGTIIEKVDMKSAWEDAKKFYYELITAALEQSKKVKIYYSKGNHDKSFSWAFIQMLKVMFPSIIVDDSLKPRKCIHWRKCFIGFGHCEYNKSKVIDLFKQFILDFPVEYAESDIKEIHAGHLHYEQGKDEGIMVRRLPSGNKTDEWSADNGYIGAHKRFMIFEYEPDFLSAIYYV